jgi:hypothetical protein
MVQRKEVFEASSLNTQRTILEEVPVEAFYQL